MHIRRLREVKDLIAGAEIHKTTEGKYRVVFSFVGDVRFTVSGHDDSKAREWQGIDPAVRLVNSICPKLEFVKVFNFSKGVTSE